MMPGVTRACPSVSTGAKDPLEAGPWKGAQIPIEEHAMITIQLHQTATVTPRLFLAGQAQS